MSDEVSILILDDEAIVCERLEEHLRREDYQVESFTDSESALARLAEKRFDVVITDLKMKGPTGLDVLQFIRRQGRGTEVIIITGYATMESLREAEYTGVFDFIAKPFQLESMSGLVKKAARKAKKLRGPSNP